MCLEKRTQKNSKFSAHFQWESGQNCRKINQVAVESFQIPPVSQLGSHCICMQLKTFGPNERVTLGTNTTITAAGFWTLCYIISCGSGSERRFPNCISTFQCSDVSGCSWVFFLMLFLPERREPRLTQEKTTPTLICCQLNCLPLTLAAWH